MAVKIIAREMTGDQAALQQRSQRIVSALVEMGVTHVVGLPDNATRIVFELLDQQAQVQVVLVCREGEAWAIASGLWVGGKFPVVIIQNTGFLESGDGLRGTAMQMGVPLLSIMDYRGHHTLGQKNIDSAAQPFEPTLRAWEMPYRFLEQHQEAKILTAAQQEAHRLGRPVAVLMT